MNSLRLLTALLATSSAVFANGGGYLSGIKSTGPFRPVNVDSVEMVSEKLDIELTPDAALISIVYQLHNPGAAVEVEMGFPCAVTAQVEYKDGRYPQPVKSMPQLESFTLTADGKPVDSKLVKDHATLPCKEELEADGAIVTGWQVVKIPFAAGQTSTVAVSYRNPWLSEISYMSRDVYKSAPSFSYLFSAAALWKGPIKSGEVTVRAAPGVNPDDVRLSHPKRFKREGGKWSWNFTGFEPTLQDDLEVVMGDAEYNKWVKDEEGNAGYYVSRGPDTDLGKLRQSGKWSFVSRQFTVSASSRLKPEKNSRETGFPWFEAAEGDGIGESVTITMDKPVKASRLLIQNGFHGDHDAASIAPLSGKQFQERSRVKKLGVSVNGGASFSVELPDSSFTFGIVNLPADAGDLKTVRLTIEEAFPGTKLRETCIYSVGAEIPLSKPPVLKGSR